MASVSLCVLEPGKGPALVDPTCDHLAAAAYGVVLSRRVEAGAQSLMHAPCLFSEENFERLYLKLREPLPAGAGAAAGRLPRSLRYGRPDRVPPRSDLASEGRPGPRRGRDSHGHDASGYFLYQTATEQGRP